MNDVEHGAGGSGYAGSCPAEDLSLWLDRRTLLRLVWHVVQTVGETALASSPAILGQYRLPPRTLLTLLTFCYAAGIYASRAVEEDLSRDDTIRYLCAWGFPSQQTLREFRQRNRAVIADCLYRVCLYVWVKRKGGQDPAYFASGGREFDVPVQVDRRTESVLWCDVQERLNLAELVDDSPFNR